MKKFLMFILAVSFLSSCASSKNASCPTNDKNYFFKKQGIKSKIKYDRNSVRYNPMWKK